MKYRTFFRVLHLWIVTCFVFCISAESLRANSELRDWKMNDAGATRAEIVDVDEAAKTVRLREVSGAETVYSIGVFSALDQAWILEWIELEEETKQQLAQLGGKIENFEGKGPTLTTGFHVYYPSGEPAPGEQRPIMLLFDPSGHPLRYLLRHMEAAEAAKMIIVTCDWFRNGLPNQESNARLKELLPIFQATVKYDPKRFFMGGTSGGALGAFNRSAAFPEIRCAGIYSNGGWLGEPNNWDRPFPAMRVAMVNGDKDAAANEWLEESTEVLQQKGSVVAVMAFEGAHQLPPPSVQIKAFRWLLGEIE